MRQEEIDEIKHPSNARVEHFLSTGWKAGLRKWWDQAEADLRKASTEETRTAIRKAMEVHRRPETIVGFLTKEQAWELCQNHTQDMMIAHGLTVFSDGKAFYFTDDSLIGHGILPKSFVGCTFPLPLRTVHTVFKSIDEFCEVFCRRHDNGEPERYLASVQDVLDYLESEYWS